MVVLTARQACQIRHEPRVLTHGDTIENRANVRLSATPNTLMRVLLLNLNQKYNSAVILFVSPGVVVPAGSCRMPVRVSRVPGVASLLLQLY